MKPRCSIRKKVLEQHSVLQIVYKWKFESVIADTMTILICKGKRESSAILIRNRPEEEFVEIRSSQLLSTPECAFRGFKDLKTKALVEKILERSTPLGILSKSTSGFGGKSALISRDAIPLKSPCACRL